MFRTTSLLYLMILPLVALTSTSEVCDSCEYNSIQKAINDASPHDTILIHSGTYKEYDITIDRSLTLLGNKDVLIDAQIKGYGLIILADSVNIHGINITNVGRSYIKDYAAIYISKSKYFKITDTYLTKVFFGVLVEKSKNGVIADNVISSEAINEAGSGNGIHMWYSDSVTISNNELFNLRDGIYFEFVTHSSVSNNYSHDNLRYGLHFMFSNNDEYHNNHFSHNGAGVAVMFSKFITMTYNTFINNWGSASYGLLLKEINDAEIKHNIIQENTIGIYAEGSTRINYSRNDFIKNGWAVKISGACYENRFETNNFMYNSFDVSYNSKMNDNMFDHNHWSEYTGYDLDRNGIGDVPFRPVKLFSYIVNRTPETILLLRSLFIEMLNFSEKVTPVFTPDDLQDANPEMRRIT